MTFSRTVDRTRAKRADGRDLEVARRLRARRLACAMPQVELARRVGVTFQQIQKYEKGANRIGAGRLQRIAEALDVLVSFFFDSTFGQTNDSQSKTSSSIFEFVQTAGAVRILKAYQSIKSQEAKRLLVHMSEELANRAAEGRLQKLSQR